VLKRAEDEGRFGRVSIPRRAWAPPGVRPRAPGQRVREDTSVSAAVAPAQGKMPSLSVPRANTALMPLFVEQVSQTCSAYFIVLQVDRAGGQGAKARAVPENRRLIPQAACSPALNPVEHSWEAIRENQVPTLALPALEDVIDKVGTGLQQVEAAPERLRSMTSFPHFRFAC
jgi:hypothetical protein